MDSSGYSRMQDGNTSLRQDYGEEDHDDFLLTNSMEGGRQNNTQNASNSSNWNTAQANASARAKEISASIQSTAQKFVRNTREWFADNSRQQEAPPRQRYVAEEQMPLPPEFAQEQALEEMLLTGRRQSQIPLSQGEIVAHHPVHEVLYHSLSLTVPIDAEQEFVAVLPNGENRIIDLPEVGVKSGEKLEILFSGLCRDDFGVEYCDAASGAKEMLVRMKQEDRVLELYRRHNPQEREAVMPAYPNFPITFYEGEFGAHVLHGTFVGIPSMIVADDIVTSLNGEAVSTAADLVARLERLTPEDFVCLGLLRKSPPPAQHCPAGHALRLITPQDPIPAMSQCHRCANPLVHVARVYRCQTCDWNICSSCYDHTYEAMHSAKNANDPEPDWASEYEICFGKTLTFSVFDKGTKIRIFWQTTGEWWLGEISGYSRERGHEVLYEEGSGDSKRCSRQTIADISLYSYFVMKKISKPSNTEISDLMHSTEVSNTEEEEEHYELTQDELNLLQGIQAELAPPMLDEA